MEHPARARMNAALQTWRRELAAQGGLTAEIRRELETHLLDCMAMFQGRGFDEAESFELARRRVGQPEQLNTEFKKAMNPPSLWNRPLTILAWAVYVISFFLPTLGEARGYQCATMQRIFWPGFLQGEWMSIHYELLLLANLVMLTSPLWLARFSGSLRQVRWLQHLTLGATILVWGFVLQLLLAPERRGLEVGCYGWAISFALLYFSVLLQYRTMRKNARHQAA